MCPVLEVNTSIVYIRLLKENMKRRQQNLQKQAPELAQLGKSLTQILLRS